VTFTPATGVLSGTPAAGTGGTYPITFKATSSSGNTTQNFTLTVDQAPAITSANNTTFTVGAAGTFMVTTTGTPTPSLVETGALPSGVTFTDNGNGTGTLSGTPATGTASSYPLVFTATNGIGTPATQNFTLTVSAAAACTSGGSESLLSGGYAVLLKGFDSSGNPVLIGGVLTFNGTNNGGLITAGAMDMNLNAGVQTNLSVTSGSYGVGSDHRGCMVITTAAGTQNYRFSLGNISGTPGVASTGHVIGFDSAGPFASGVLRKQSGSFSTSTLNGSFAFGASSAQNTAQGGGNFGLVGEINFNGSGGITGGVEDFNGNGTLDGSSSNLNWPGSPIIINSGGTYTVSSSNGRGTLAVTVVGATGTFHSVLYVVSSSEALFMSSDAQTTGTISAGEALKQSGTLSGNPLSGAYIGYQSGLGGTAGTSRTTLLLITASGSGISGTQLRNDGGSFQSKSIGTGITYSVASSGRMTVSGGGGTGPIFYLVSPNQVFVLGGGNSVDTGVFQSQTGGPFTNSSASGTYAFATVDPQDLNVSDESGVATFASPNVSGTSDSNSNGSQNLNKPFGPQGYSVDSTGLGIIPSGCTISATSTTCQTVFYVISPTKAVVMDTDPTNTNPKIQVADK
jgi:hypothetical protein